MFAVLFVEVFVVAMPVVVFVGVFLVVVTDMMAKWKSFLFCNE